MAKKRVEKKSDSKGFAFLATFLSVVGFILAILLWKDDDYVMFYAKQSLVIFIVAVIVSAINWVLAFIPIIGSFIVWVLQLIVIILWVLTWVYALSGKKKDVWLVGDYAKKIKI